MSQYPVAPKTQAAGVSAAVAGAILYVLQQYAFRGAVPAGIESLIYASVPGLVAFAAAYIAPHQPRPSVAVTPLPSNVSIARPAATAQNRDPVSDEEAAAIRARYSSTTGGGVVTPATPEERLVIPGDQDPPPGT